MQTITGRLAKTSDTTNLGVAVSFEIKHRKNSKAELTAATVTTDSSGNFSIQLNPGMYFFAYGPDLIPFRVKETTGSTTLSTLVEKL